MTVAGHPTTHSPTTVLADWVATTTYTDLPDSCTVRLRDLFLDFIGISAFASARAESTPAVLAAITQLDPSEGPATVIGEPRGFSWQYAALLNGCYAHSLDFDDTNRRQNGHPGAPVIAAAIAEAERSGSDARAFLEAIAVGYEVSCRVGAALGPTSYDRGFHVTSTAGIFGAVAAVGKLRSFDAATVENAFGLAASKAAGSMQYLANGSWNKRLHPGFAAHDAWVCATLAETGVIGAASALHGRYGLLTGYTNDPHPDELTDGLGHTWLLLETAVKPYPSCRYTHAAIDAALALRDKVPAELRPEATLRVDLPATAMKIVGERTESKINPRGSVDAQFSVYFQVAAAWLDGRVDWDSYQRLLSPDLVALMARVSTRQSALAKHAATLTVEVRGDRLEHAVSAPLGEPENWVGAAALREKFLSLTEPVYGPAHARSIADRVAALEPTTSMSTLLSLLRRPASA
jgi:2-methylcitrate dehydratase PrpD